MPLDLTSCGLGLFQTVSSHQLDVHFFLGLADACLQGMSKDMDHSIVVAVVQVDKTQEGLVTCSVDFQRQF